MHAHLRDGRGVRLILLADDPQRFEEIFAIDDLRAAVPAFELARAFQPAVTPEGRLDLPEAKRIAERTPGVAVVAELNSRLVQNHERVGEMVALLTQELSNFLGIALPPVQQRQIEAAVLFAFTSLVTQTQDGWIFYRKESGHSTTYQYNILFAVQNESTGDAIFGLPLGLTIQVDREYERVLFITVKDEVSYSVEVAALKVLLPFAAARPSHPLHTSRSQSWNRLHTSDVRTAMWGSCSPQTSASGSTPPTWSPSTGSDSSTSSSRPRGGRGPAR